MKAFLGMGHLGANFVRAMIHKGDQVQVWNRTASKAKALEDSGAKAFENAADAVKDADVIHLTLKDDATVNEVLALAEAGLKPGAIIIDHTTTSVDGAIARTKEWKEKGYTYIHAPVFMGPQNALESTGNMLVSGDQALIENITPQLQKMTGKVINFGPETGKAAGMKLIGNLFLIAITGGLADGLTLAKAVNISPLDVSNLFDAWNPGTSVGARLKKMTSGEFDKPTWELNMARKDAGLMIQEAENKGAHLVVVPAVAYAMDQFIERGHGNDDWTVIGKDAIA